jgi:GNAT superfamily N-acetyltransferase
VLEEQHFDPKIHDRSSFHCGEPQLDGYIRKYAAQQSQRGLASVFVLVDDADPGKILGFYTLSAAQVDVGQLSPIEQKKLPKYPVPCFRLGRLARDLSSRGTGVGELLLALAVDRCRKARDSVGAYALLVDAKNPAAKSFYERFGFMPCRDSPMVLYMPIR